MNLLRKLTLILLVMKMLCKSLIVGDQEKISGMVETSRCYRMKKTRMNIFMKRKRMTTTKK